MKTPLQVLTREICEIFHVSFFVEHSRAAAALIALTFHEVLTVSQNKKSYKQVLFKVLIYFSGALISNLE